MITVVDELSSALERRGIGPRAHDRFRDKFVEDEATSRVNLPRRTRRLRSAAGWRWRRTCAGSTGRAARGTPQGDLRGAKEAYRWAVGCRGPGGVFFKGEYDQTGSSVGRAGETYICVWGGAITGHGNRRARPACPPTYCIEVGALAPALPSRNGSTCRPFPPQTEKTNLLALWSDPEKLRWIVLPRPVRAFLSVSSPPRCPLIRLPSRR